MTDKERAEGVNPPEDWREKGILADGSRIDMAKHDAEVEARVWREAAKIADKGGMWFSFVETFKGKAREAEEKLR